jgi:23S rRNA pseudouridine1911/1915/1917 synthase
VKKPECSAVLHSFLINQEERDQRIDAFLALRIEDLTRSRIQDLIRNGTVLVNDRQTKPSYRLKPSDRVTVTIPPARPYHLGPEAVEFSLIHEDSSLIVLNKPPGLVIHPSPGHLTGTLVHGLLARCPDLSGIGGVLRPGIVHRLDKDTSGLLVVAKNDRAHSLLSVQFKAGAVKKRYLALVHGKTRAREGKIDLPIARHPKRRKEMAVVSEGGKKALTHWQKIEDLGERFSFLSVMPKTGRTHQIRVHLSYIGHPILGDTVYGFRRQWWRKHLGLKNGREFSVERHMLHAETLGFVHPESGEYCEYKAPLPEDMTDMMEKLKSLDF